MPRIEMDNDAHVFTVQVKDKGTVCVDAFEMSGVMMEAGFNENQDPTVEDIDKTMRTVAWMENGGTLESISKYEMFAVASKVMSRMDSLGNE